MGASWPYDAYQEFPPMMDAYIRNVAVPAMQELERRGYALSWSQLYRLSKLLPTRRRLRRSPYLHVPYTNEEVDWLEWMLILKCLGMTTVEVRAWLAAPDPGIVEFRLRRTRTIVQRAEALLARALHPTNGDSP